MKRILPKIGIMFLAVLLLTGAFAASAFATDETADEGVAAVSESAEEIAEEEEETEPEEEAATLAAEEETEAEVEAEETTAYYTVTFMNGDTTVATVQVEAGGSLTIADYNLTKDGYEFQGWSTSSTSTSGTYKTGKTYTISKDMTLYAAFKKLYTYTLTFVLDCEEDLNVKISEGTTTTDGWTVSSVSGSSVTYTQQSTSRPTFTITDASDIWDLSGYESYSQSFSKTGGTGSYSYTNRDSEDGSFDSFTITVGTSNSSTKTYATYTCTLTDLVAIESEEAEYYQTVTLSVNISDLEVKVSVGDTVSTYWVVTAISDDNTVITLKTTESASNVSLTVPNVSDLWDITGYTLESISHRGSGNYSGSSSDFGEGTVWNVAKAGNNPKTITYTLAATTNDSTADDTTTDEGGTDTDADGSSSGSDSTGSTSDDSASAGSSSATTAGTTTAVTGTDTTGADASADEVETGDGAPMIWYLLTLLMAAAAAAAMVKQREFY